MKAAFPNFIILVLLINKIRTELLTDYEELARDDKDYYVDVNNEVSDQRSPNKHLVSNSKSRFPAKTYNSDLSEHTMVSESNVFPYMACILRGAKFLSNGVLVDENWVLTTADSLFLMSESIRLLRIRLGSINYKKGGVLVPAKLLEFHPYFDDKSPNYDLVLIMLAKPMKYTPTTKAIRILMNPKEVTATHFIVTSWPGPLEARLGNATIVRSMDTIKRQRILTVTHLHPSNPKECDTFLKSIGATSDTIMCLDSLPKKNCMREIGAPVVLNHVLWAVVSSWTPEDCDKDTEEPIFANLVSSKNISTWIHATIHGHRWKQS